MGKTPLVSVILLTLNSEKYIARALRSVYSQDYENIEVVVVDAGSSDSTKDIVTSFSGAKWLVLPNSDMGMARNFGVRESVGDVIMFLDSDDIYLEGKIERQVDALLNCADLDFVASQAYVMRTHDQLVGVKDWTYQKLSIDSFLKGHCYSLATLCLRRDRLPGICKFHEGEAGRYCEDWSFQLQLLLENLTFQVLPFCSVLVELRPDSHTDWSSQPKMKRIGRNIVAAAITRLEADKKDYTSDKQAIIDDYEFKLAVSLLAVGDLVAGRKSLNKLTVKYRLVGRIFYVMSYLLPKLIFTKILKYLWSKRQNDSFKWSEQPHGLRQWVYKHNINLDL